jgi:hypothetical protein
MAIFGEILETPSIVPGRKCGACSLCCKVLRIDELQKPIGKWCNHCAPGKSGCRIHDQRPSECQSFYCGWLTSPRFGSDWFPLTSRFVFCAVPKGDSGQGMRVYVDPGYPTAWQRQPYYEEIRLWAQKHPVEILIGNRMIVLCSDKTIDFGTLLEGEYVVRLATGEFVVRNSP